MPFLDVVAGTLPSGNECYPQTPQALLDLFADYLDVDFDETYSLLVIGPGPVAVEDQDKIWFETTADNGPLSINSFDTNLGEWVSFFPAHGTTAERPASPKDYQLFFDTTIHTMLIYERDEWRTESGSPGDIKPVTAASEAAAETQNPGWSLYTAGAGRVLGVAGAGSGLTVRSQGATVGEELHTLTIGELPAHTHSLPNVATRLSNVDLDINGVNSGVTNTDNTATGSVGSGTPFNVMQPTLFLYWMVKD